MSQRKGIGTLQWSGAGEAHSALHGGPAHRQGCAPHTCATGQEANLVCYVDAFGILPFLPLFSEACRTERLYLSFLIPPKYFPNEPLLSLITMAREFSRRGYFWQEMRFFQTRIGTLMIVCVDSVLLEVIIWGQLGNLCRLQWAMNPQRNCLKWRGLCIPEQGSEFG